MSSEEKQIIEFNLCAIIDEIQRLIDNTSLNFKTKVALKIVLFSLKTALKYFNKCKIKTNEDE